MFRRFVRLVATIAMMLALTAVLAEALLQVASLFARGRGGAVADGVRSVVCVGDSHTYGAMVTPEESYPGQLQRLLDDRAPGGWTVSNLGIPGMNTSEVRTQLRRTLASQQPDVVLVWCGVNNAWNRTATAVGDSWLAAGGKLRLPRMLRVWLHDRRLEASVGAHAPGGVPERAVVRQRRDEDDSRVVRRVVRDGHEEEVVLQKEDIRVDAEMEARADADYRGMVADARAAGIPIGFVTYPIEVEAFAAVNRAMRRVAGELEVPLIETGLAVSRVPPGQRELLWGAHPNAAMYAEVAREILPVVLAGGRIATKPGEPLVSLDFERFAAGDARTQSDEQILLHGGCGSAGTGCAVGRGCYRWRPQGRTCNLRVGMRRANGRVRLSVRVRVDAFPTGDGGRDIAGVQEDAFGTGILLVLTPDRRMGLQALPGKVACEPLATRLGTGVWYGVRVEGEKSESTTLTLALLAEDGATLETASCAGVSTAGGTFTQLTLGNNNPRGAIADLTFDDVEVALVP